MIYKIEFKDSKKTWQFYMSADTKGQVIRRAVDQYRVDPKNLTVLQAISDEEMDRRMPSMKEIKAKRNEIVSTQQIVEEDNEKIIPAKIEYTTEVINKVDELLAKAYPVSGADRERLLSTYKRIDAEENIRDQLLDICSKNYKKVRLYKESTGKRGNYIYMILVKENSK